MRKTICVATDFSSMPGPRWRKEGSHSGQEFREDVLAPAFREATASDGTVLVDLDGAEGYASSFLEEAFGGLVRQFPGLAILKYLEIKSDEDPYRKAEIDGYIRDASSRGDDGRSERTGATA